MKSTLNLLSRVVELKGVKLFLQLGELLRNSRSGSVEQHVDKGGVTCRAGGE
jgi:hypothetical protein